LTYAERVLDSIDARATELNPQYSALVNRFREQFIGVTTHCMVRLQVKTAGIRPSHSYESPEAKKEAARKINAYYESSPAFVAEQLQSFEFMCSLAENHRLPLVVVLFPLGKGWNDNINPAWEAKCLPKVRQICSAHKVPLISCCDGLDDTCFSDWTHLNAKGESSSSRPLQISCKASRHQDSWSAFASTPAPKLASAFAQMISPVLEVPA
jgi:hypothetical protein